MDTQGNLDVADADITVTVDTLPADLIGAITIPEDLNGDGILNADELAQTVPSMHKWRWDQMQSMAQW